MIERDVFKHVYLALAKAVEESGHLDGEARCRFLSFLLGGTLCARGVIDRVGVVRDAWVGAAAEDALRLTRACAVHLATRQVHGILEGAPLNSRVSAAKFHRTNLVNLFSAFVPEEETTVFAAEAAFDALEQQFAYEFDDPAGPYKGGAGLMGWWEASLLIDLALEACGRRRSLDWKRTRFPIRSSDDCVWLTPPPLVSPEEVVLVAALLLECGTQALQHYTECYKRLGVKG